MPDNHGHRVTTAIAISVSSFSGSPPALNSLALLGSERSQGWGQVHKKHMKGDRV